MQRPPRNFFTAMATVLLSDLGVLGGVIALAFELLP
jgi:hypothetical protein